jgi:hypothetical protein
MKRLLPLAFALVAIASVSAQITNLGTITIHNGIQWDSAVLRTNETLAGYRVYVGPTNGGLAGLKVLGEVGENRWPGASAQLNGPHLVALKTMARVSFTNAATMTLTNALRESDEFSELVILTFRAGVPLPPSNLQIYSVVIAAATNALPPLPK